MTELLLDTHVFLWWQTKDRKLGASAYDAIADPENEVWISVGSIWEIAMKAARGKLAFGLSPTAAVEANGFRELPIKGMEAETAAALDWDHTDPFDRLLVAQAIGLSLVLVTADHAIRRFRRVPQLWAAA